VISVVIAASAFKEVAGTDNRKPPATAPHFRQQHYRDAALLVLSRRATCAPHRKPASAIGAFMWNAHKLPAP
jgi:hypothetical protein